jgi:hypothetical protein
MKINDGIGFMKAGLERIIASHAARREAEQQTTQPPAVELFQPDGPVAEQQLEPAVEEQPTPPAEDYTDSTVWVRVEQPEMDWVTIGAFENVQTFWALTGKTLVTYTKRVPEHGEAAVIRLRPKAPPKSREPEIEWSNIRDGRISLDGSTRKQWVGPGSEKYEQQGPNRAIPDQNGRHHPVVQGRRVYNEQ